MTRWTKRLLRAGVVAGVGYALWRVIDERTRASKLAWTPQPFPSPPMPVIHEPGGSARAEATRTAPEPAAPGLLWIEAPDGTCPASHPVKAKLASGIFHVPGGGMYDRTSPDRCYRDAAAAEADGLRASKR